MLERVDEGLFVVRALEPVLGFFAAEGEGAGFAGETVGVFLVLEVEGVGFVPLDVGFDEEGVFAFEGGDAGFGAGEVDVVDEVEG